MTTFMNFANSTKPITLNGEKVVYKQYGNITQLHNPTNEYILTNELHHILPQNIPWVMQIDGGLILQRFDHIDASFNNYLHSDIISKIDNILNAFSSIQTIQCKEILRLNRLSLLEKFKRGEHRIRSITANEKIQSHYKNIAKIVTDEAYQDVIHGDLNMGNVLIGIDDEIKIIDFEYTSYGISDYDWASYLSNIIIHITNGKIFYDWVDNDNLSELIRVHIRYPDLFAQLFGFCILNQIIFNSIAIPKNNYLNNVSNLLNIATKIIEQKLEIFVIESKEIVDLKYGI